MNYKMTRNELKQLLESDYYGIKDYPKCHIEEFEQVNSWGNDILSLFDTLADKLGRIPSQSEFVEEGTLKYKELFYKNGNDGRMMTNYYQAGKTIFITLQWTDNMVTAVQNRLARTYQSSLLEYATLIQLKDLYPNHRILTQHYLDITMGVDIAVITPENQVFYIHITSNTHWGRGKVASKGTRKPYIPKDGKKHFWKRNFDVGHVIFAYDKQISLTTDIVNGNILFNDYYIVNEVDHILKTAAAESLNEDCQLYKFYSFLYQNKILTIDELNATIK